VLTAASANNISLSQTPAGAGNLLINGAAATAGVATLDTQRQVLLTFAADESAHTFVVYGADDNGAAIQESLTGTASTVATTQNFRKITRISISAAAAGAITVGTNGVGATPWQIVSNAMTPFNLAIGITVVGTVNFTWQYTYDDPSGTYPNPATVTTTGYVNTAQPYSAITQFPTAWGLTALTSKAVATDSAITTPIMAWRLLVNSGTGSAQAIALQSGIAGS
jgi:hypothetical protein